MNEAMPEFDRLNPDEIQANLKTRRIGKQVLVYDSTSSTNNIAAEYAKNPKNDGMVIFAEEQTGGRGRGGNKWMSARGESILCSVILTDCELNSELLCLTCAVAGAESIGGKAKIKWPNDLFLNGKKVGGILVESKVINGCVTHILGIGINCHQRAESFPAELRATATSIDIESGGICDRISLAKRLLTSIDDRLRTAKRSGKKIIRKWRKRSIQLNHRITVVFNGRKFAGHCIGIDPEKGLIVQLDTGGIRMFGAAHTTIWPDRA